MKKALIIFLIVCLSLVCLVSFGGCSSRTEKLIVYNWADYIDTTILNEFNDYYFERTGKKIEIVYSTYDTNETMMTKILNDDADVDLICPSEYSIMRLALAGKLNTLDKTKIGTVEYINQNIVTKVDEIFKDSEINLNDYFVPYMWGTLGVMYTRVDKNGNEIISDEMAEDAGWGLLWNSWYDEAGELTSYDKLNGKILMKDSVRDAYCAAVMYMYEMKVLPEGYEDYTPQDLINCTDDVMINAAEKILQQQKASGCLKGYEVDLGKDDMIMGSAYVNLAWSGDAMYAIEEAETEGVELGYIAPQSGGNVWFDGWCIPKTCKNIEAAELFIEWICQPYVAVYNMYEIGYSSAVDREAFMNDAEAILAIVDSYQYIETSDKALQLLSSDRIERVAAIWEDEAAVASIQAVLNEAMQNPETMWDEGSPLEKLDDLIFATDESGELYGAYDAVYEFLYDEDWLALIRYPDDFSLLGVMKDFGDKNNTIVSMWDSVKASGGWDWTVAGICLGVSTGVILIFVLAFVLKTKVFYGRYKKLEE